MLEVEENSKNARISAENFELRLCPAAKPQARNKKSLQQNCRRL
jgi:hypothetical protein